MRPAVFLDRDGTIIEHVHHLADPTDVRLIPGAGEAIARLNQQGFSVVVVTNQSVVGRGMLTAEGLDEIHRVMKDQLSACGATVDAVYWCDQVPVGQDTTVVEHPDRKPGPGMLQRAADELRLDLADSWMVGDTISDLLAGRNAGCAGSILVRTGCGAETAGDERLDGLAHHVADDLLSAVGWIEANAQVPVWLPQPSADQPPPFFIVGAERSGTTLFRLILSAHPKITCHSEFEYVVDFLDPQTGDIAIERFRDHLAAHRKFPELFASLETMLDKPQVDVSQATLARAFLEQFRREQGRSVVGATIHRHFDRILHIWPDARFLHIIRDPRDVARSNVKMGWAGTPYHGVRRWIEAERLWESVVARVGPERWTDVCYESLVQSPVDELTRICEFLGVEFDDAMFRYSDSTTYDELDPAMTRQWKRKMKPRDVQLVEGRIGDLLTSRGYEPSGLAPVQPSAWERGWQELRHRYNCRTWRVRRYGFGLLLKHFVAKKLGLVGVRDRARRAIQDIDHAHLK